MNETDYEVKYDEGKREVSFNVKGKRPVTIKIYGEVNNDGKKYLLINRPGITRDSFLYAEAVKAGERFDDENGFSRIYGVAMDIDDKDAMAVGMSNLDFFKTDTPVWVKKMEGLYNIFGDRYFGFTDLMEAAVDDDGFEEIENAFKNVKPSEKAKKMAAAAFRTFLEEYQDGIFSYFWENFDIEKHKDEIYEDASWLLSNAIEEDNLGKLKDEPDLKKIKDRKVREAVSLRGSHD